MARFSIQGLESRFSELWNHQDVSWVRGGGRKVAVSGVLKWLALGHFPVNPRNPSSLAELLGKQPLPNVQEVYLLLFVHCINIQLSQGGIWKKHFLLWLFEIFSYESIRWKCNFLEDLNPQKLRETILHGWYRNLSSTAPRPKEKHPGAYDGCIINWTEDTRKASTSKNELLTYYHQIILKWISRKRLHRLLLLYWDWGLFTSNCSQERLLKPLLVKQGLGSKLSVLVGRNSLMANIIGQYPLSLSVPSLNILRMTPSAALSPTQCWNRAGHYGTPGHGSPSMSPISCL